MVVTKVSIEIYLPVLLWWPKTRLKEPEIVFWHIKIFTKRLMTNRAEFLVSLIFACSLPVTLRPQCVNQSQSRVMSYNLPEEVLMPVNDIHQGRGFKRILTKDRLQQSECRDLVKAFALYDRWRRHQRRGRKETTKWPAKDWDLDLLKVSFG